MEWLIKFFHVDGCSAVDVTAVATCCYAVLALITLIAVLYIGLGQIRQLRNDSHKQLMIRILENWGSQDILEAREIVATIIRRKSTSIISSTDEKQIRDQALELKKEMLMLEKNGDKKFFQIVRISDYMETIGYMMKSKSDRQKVKDLFGDAIVSYYMRFKEWIEEKRKDYPNIYKYFTELYEFCKK